MVYERKRKGLNHKSSYERILMAPTCRLIARFLSLIFPMIISSFLSISYLFSHHLLSLIFYYFLLHLFQSLVFYYYLYRISLSLSFYNQWSSIFLFPFLCYLLLFISSISSSLLLLLSLLFFYFIFLNISFIFFLFLIFDLSLNSFFIFPIFHLIPKVVALNY